MSNATTLRVRARRRTTSASTMVLPGGKLWKRFLVGPVGCHEHASNEVCSDVGIGTRVPRGGGARGIRVIQPASPTGKLHCHCVISVRRLVLDAK